MHTSADVSCDQVNICHTNADCLYDDAQLKSICVCRHGFTGDGLVCTPQGNCYKCINVNVLFIWAVKYIIHFALLLKKLEKCLRIKISWI